jgi:hypothetical protein
MGQTTNCSLTLWNGKGTITLKFTSTSTSKPLSRYDLFGRSEVKGFRAVKVATLRIFMGFPLRLRELMLSVTDPVALAKALRNSK